MSFLRRLARAFINVILGMVKLAVLFVVLLAVTALPDSQPLPEQRLDPTPSSVLSRGRIIAY